MQHNHSVKIVLIHKALLYINYSLCIALAQLFYTIDKRYIKVHPFLVDLNKNSRGKTYAN